MLKQSKRRKISKGNWGVVSRVKKKNEADVELQKPNPKSISMAKTWSAM